MQTHLDRPEVSFSRLLYRSSGPAPAPALAPKVCLARSRDTSLCLYQGNSRLARDLTEAGLSRTYICRCMKARRRLLPND